MTEMHKQRNPFKCNRPVTVCANDAYCPITGMVRKLSHYTVQLYRHDVLTVLLVLKSGLLITNQIVSKLVRALTFIFRSWR